MFHIYFSCLISINLISMNLKLLLIDATYKSKKYQMMLLHVIRCMIFNSFFIIVLIFMALEEVVSYHIMLEYIKQFFIKVLYPNMFVANYELIIINANKEIFLSVTIFLCFQHIYKNNLENCKQDFTNKQQQEFLQG